METHTTTATTTYTVHVTPRFDGLTPKYDALVYINRRAGICGPDITVKDLDNLTEVDEWLGRFGYRRDGLYGPVTGNGSAAATVESTVLR